MSIARLQATTGEDIYLKYSIKDKIELNYVDPNMNNYRSFSVYEYLKTGLVDFFIIEPENRILPNRIKVKMHNMVNVEDISSKSYPLYEYREFMLYQSTENVSDRAFWGNTYEMVIIYAPAGRPKYKYSALQYFEFELQFIDRQETLICPISKSSTFSMNMDHAQFSQQQLPDGLIKNK